MSITHQSTTPAAGDTSQVLLSKLVQLFGGSPDAGDGTAQLVSKLVFAAIAADNDAITILPGGMVQQSIQAVPHTGDPIAIDFSQEVYKEVALTANLSVTTTNLQPGTSTAMKITADGSLRTISCPAAWTFVGGTAPADIAANKKGILSLTSFGTTDADVIAAYAVEP
jgi:hypothetical protein